MILRDGPWYTKSTGRQYEGKWIAIAGNRVVASGADRQQVYENARTAHPQSPVAVTRVSAMDIRLLFGER